MAQDNPASGTARAKRFFSPSYSCFWIAALGLALESAAGEFGKFAPAPELAQSSLDTLFARILVIALVVVVYLIARSKSDGFVFKDRIWPLVVCLGFSAGLALYFSGFLFVASGRLMVVLGFYITTIAGSAYLLIWFDRIFAFGIRNTLLTVAASLVLRGLVQILLVLMQQAPAVVIITALPLLSLPCFVTVFAQSRDVDTESINKANLEYSVASPTKIRYSKQALIALLLMLFLIPLLTGVPSENTALISESLGISWYRQGSCIGVNILVGALLYLFANLHFNKTLLLVYFLAIIGLTATAIFTVNSGSSEALIVGSLALQASKKMLDIGVVFPAFIFSAEGQKVYSRHVAGRLCSFSGRLVVLLLVWSPAADAALRNVLDSVLLFVLFATAIIFYFCLESPLPDTAAAAPAPEESVPLRQPFKEAVTKLAEDWRLTPTEETILALVARGSNADSVSKELVISVNTAKTHIRNIYAKLGVHSQQELIALVNETKDLIKSEYDN